MTVSEILAVLATVSQPNSWPTVWAVGDVETPIGKATLESDGTVQLDTATPQWSVKNLSDALTALNSPDAIVKWSDGTVVGQVKVEGGAHKVALKA